MNKFSSFSTDSSISSGACAMFDFLRTGRIHVNFYINTHFIGVEIAGVSSDSKYVLRPLNKTQLIQNQAWVERFVYKCHNPEEIIKTLKIKTA